MIYIHPCPEMSLALWLRNGCYRLSGWITQPLPPLTAAWSHFWPNAYIIVRTAGTKQQAEGQRDLVWSITFLSFLPYRQKHVLYRRFCDHITLILMTGCVALWILLHIPRKGSTCSLESCHSSVFLWRSNGFTFGVCKIESLFCVSRISAISWNIQTFFLPPRVFIMAAWCWPLFWITVNQSRKMWLQPTGSYRWLHFSKALRNSITQGVKVMIYTENRIQQKGCLRMEMKLS